MEKFLRIEELAALLGVPKSWIYDRTRTGIIPHLKIGKHTHFNAFEVKEWLETCKKGPEDLLYKTLSSANLPNLSTGY
ncbi:MAG TPA: helix-turn-helix domain-containing protein [Candidatus Hypogeohydataceae bacterium YC41]